MSHSRLIRTPGLLAAAMAASFCGVAQAGPEQIIFSAENALYGAGYEIGKADGWMDNTLRSAIRQYQSGHDELQTTGNLGPETLSALGIAVGENVSVSGNSVADRQAARAAVGLKEKRVDSSSATRTVAVAPEPEPEPEAPPQPAVETEPDQEQVQEQVQEENTRDEPEAGFAATPASAGDQKSQPEPATPEIAEPAQNNPAEEPTEQPTPKPEVTASSEQAAPPETAEVTPEPAEAEPAPEEVATVEVENETENTAVEIAAVEPPSENKSQLPDEPTGAGNPEPAEPPQVARTSSETRTVHESSGGFFSSIFDFLFGWLI